MKRFFRYTNIRPNPKREVGDELRFHLEMRAKEFMDAGLSPEDARRAASEAFGDVAVIDDQLSAQRRERAETNERRDRIQELSMDVMFALRTFRKNKGFTAAALATLALGIGATTAVFTVVNGVLLRPLPYGDPSRLAMVWMSSKQPGSEGQLPVSSGFYVNARDNSTSFTSLAAFRSWGYTLTSNGDAEQLRGARVTPSLFPVLDVRPLLGRVFDQSDAEPGAARVVLVSHSLWQRKFGGNHSIVGERIQLGGEPLTVIGVMPEGFSFPRGAELPRGLQFGLRTDVWTPMGFTAQDLANYGTLNMAAVGRLKPGVTFTQARAELSTNLRNLLSTIGPKIDLDFQTVSLQEQAGYQVRRGLLILMGAVAFVLFIACANVTNLLMARTAARRRELAMRAALGAGRARIARQLITENVVLAAVGTVLGLLLSIWATRAMLALVPGSLPRSDDVRVDWRVALAAVSIAVVAGAIFGAISTMQIRLGHLAGTLRDGAGASGGRGQGMGRRGLVTAEVGLSIMLVIGAGLLTLSFLRLQRVEPGLIKEGVLTAAVALPIPGEFNPQRDGAGWAQFFAQLTQRMRAAPGVKAVGAVSSLPLTSTIESGGFAIVGRPIPAAGQALHAEYNVIEGDYFAAAGIRVVGGRVFDSRDAANGVGVAIVNREFVRRYFADSAVLGQQMLPYFDFTTRSQRTIVGIVDNVRQSRLDTPIEPLVYVPEAQMTYPFLNMVIRMDGDPMAVLPALKRELKSLDARIAVGDVRTMTDVFDESLARQRFSVTILTVFAGAALLLAMVGLYGVIALSVGQRTREIGVRMALGARPTDVLRHVLGEGMRMTTGGIVLGLVGALALSRLLSAMLFGVSATSPGIYVAATVAVLIVTMVATYIPARRATRVDPTAALRGE